MSSKLRTLILAVVLAWAFWGPTDANAICSASSSGRATQGGSAAPGPAMSEASSEVLGHFASSRIDEASGLARTPDGGWAIINDSGDKGRIFLSQKDGSNVREVGLKIRPWDTEDLDVAECPASIAPGETCVAIADIGDNRRKRQSAVIYFFRWKDLEAAAQVREGKANTAEPLAPLWSFQFRYPQGARNAEAFRITSAEDAIIVTKQQDRKKQAAEPAEIYRLRWRDQVAPTETTPDTTPGATIGKTTGKTDAEKSASKTDPHAAKPVLPVAQFMGKIDVPSMIRDKGLAGLVTGMAISPDRSRVLLLTYSAVVETRLVVTADRVEFQEPKVIRFSPLEQQEAIAYDESGRGFVITTEVVLSFFAQPFRKRQGAPIVAIRDPYCEVKPSTARPAQP
ncbi:MAG TPA: hypothetical protein PLZ57_01815 [Pseudobdellovibrionaceae bacterium]|nr:hypothetical protein [Pseudobdellovibrionaceae bacterium]